MNRYKKSGYAPSTLKQRLEQQLTETRSMSKDGRMEPSFAAQVEVGILMALRAWR